METTLTTTNNDLQLVVSSASSVVEQNKTSLDKAREVADRLINAIEQTEIKDAPNVRALDEECKNFILKASKTASAMMERRKPITQAFDQIRKYFTEMEGQLGKTGEKIIKIVKFRNDFAKFLADEEAKVAAERARQAAIEQEKIDTRAFFKQAFSTSLTRELETAYNKLDEIFNSMNITNVSLTKEAIKNFDTSFGGGITVYPPVKFLSKEEVNGIHDSIAPGEIANNEQIFKQSVSEKIQYYLDRVESKKQELINIAEANAAEKERLKKEAEERAAKEAEKRKQELLKFSEKSTANIEAEKTGATLQTLFDQDYQVPTANVKKELKIEVLNPAGYGQIFMFWFEREGKNLPNEKIEKKTIAQMKKFCEDAANKNAEIIDSNTIRYVEIVSAK